MKNRYPLPLIKALPSWSKCQFQQKVCFLGYVVSSHVALTFRFSSDFYQRSIQGFSRIAASLTSMLKTSGSTESTTRPGKGRVGVGGDGGDDGGHDEEHSPQGSGRVHQRTHQLERPRLRSGMIGLMVVVASRSISRRKVVKKPKEP